MSVYSELMSEGKDPLRGARKAARRTTPELEALKGKLRKEFEKEKKAKKTYTPSTRPKQSNVRKKIKGLVKSSGWFKRKDPVSGQTKLARVRPHEDPTSLSKPHTRAVSWAKSHKDTLTVAHTEYEGSPLSEEEKQKQNRNTGRRSTPPTPDEIAVRAAKIKAQHLATKRAEQVPRKGYQFDYKSKKAVDFDKPTHRDTTGVNSHTEYEGPSLSEEEKDITKDPKHQARVIAKLLADRDTLRKAAQRDASPLTTPRDDAKQARADDKAQKSWTEYEGPSLAEIGTLDMDPNDPVIDAKYVRARSKRSERARGQSPQKTKKPGLVRRIIKKLRGGESIEYEGPSLKEQLEYLIDRTGKTAPSKLSRTKKSNIMAKWLSKRGASKAERDPASVTGSTQQQKTTTKAGEPVKATHTAKTGEGGEGGTSPFVSRTRIQIRPGEGHDAGVDIIRKPHARDIDKKKKPKKKKPKSQKEQLEYLASFFLNEQPRVDPKRAAMRARGVNTSVTSQVRSAETLAQGRGAMNPTQRRDTRIKFSGAQAKRTQRSWDRPGVTAAKPGQRVPSTTQGHFGNPSK